MRNRIPMRCWAPGPVAWAGCLLALCLALGCAAHPPLPERVLGSPDHHVANGLKLMQKGRLDAAEREFRIALKLDPRCASAHRGDALARGIRRDFGGAFDAVHLALRYTTLKDLGHPLQEEFARIRWVSRDRKGWRRPSAGEEAADLARSYIIGFLNAYYHTGSAFKLGLGRGSREEGLGEAVSLTDDFFAEASHHLNLVRDMEGLSLETDFARGLVFVERVARAEAAGLLVRELPLAKVLGAEKSKGSGSATGQSRPEGPVGHPLEADIQTVLLLQIDGFVPAENTTFLPDDPMPRGWFAAALADILTRVVGDGVLETSGTPLSPFEDVPLSSPHLRAVAACSGLGLMEGREGRFRPDAPMTGLESVRSIHRLKELLKSQ